MNVALRVGMTITDFLHWEERQELRYEFDGERPVAMTGETQHHAIAAEVFTRNGNDWAGRIQGAGSTLAIPEAGIEIPLDELYEGLDFTASA